MPHFKALAILLRHDIILVITTANREEAVMNTITTEVVITNDHKLNLNIDLPKDYPTGAAIITVTVEPKTAQPINGMAELCGKYEGQIWTSDDFDEPLEDFAEYM